MNIVFCLTGNSFSGRFLDCWTATMAFCIQKRIQFLVSRKESCNIYYVRNMCLGGDVQRGKDQKPFNGKINYDYLMWIDSDIVWNPEQIIRLIEHDKDIVSGLYLMSDGKHYATVKDWDEEYFKRNGCFEFLKKEDFCHREHRVDAGVYEKSKENKNQNIPIPSAFSESSMVASLLPVSYTGMGFMLVKNGVFESMEYPWFRPIEKKIGNAIDFTMEDVAFCLLAKERGYKIWVDCNVIVGHEKNIII